MTRKALTLSLLMAAATVAAQQEDSLTIDVQLRSRAEYRNGALVPHSEGQDPAAFVNERSRLSLQYNRSDLTLRLAAQHTGVWGQEGMTERKGNVNVNEAWARINLGHHIFAQAGRQPLVYDDERIFGSADWNVAGNHHDALKLGYEDDANTLHLILAFNQNDERNYSTFYNTGGMPYKSMQAVWYHHLFYEMPVDGQLEGSFMLVNLGREYGVAQTLSPDTKYMQTLGTHLSYTDWDWNVAASLYFQTGNGHKAWMGSICGNYKINDEWSVSAGYDYLSGQNDDEWDSETTKAFEPLFGSHHLFYGNMDYFFASPWGYMPIEFPRLAYVRYAPGLSDLKLGVKSKAIPVKGLEAQLDYHYLASAAKLTGSVRGLGHEFDLKATLPIMKDVTLQGGYSFMLCRNTMDIVKGGYYKKWQDWGWLQLNIATSIFGR